MGELSKLFVINLTLPRGMLRIWCQSMFGENHIYLFDYTNTRILLYWIKSFFILIKTSEEILPHGC